MLVVTCARRCDPLPTCRARHRGHCARPRRTALCNQHQGIADIAQHESSDVLPRTKTTLNHCLGRHPVLADRQQTRAAFLSHSNIKLMLCQTPSHYMRRIAACWSISIRLHGKRRARPAPEVLRKAERRGIPPRQSRWRLITSCNKRHPWRPLSEAVEDLLA